VTLAAIVIGRIEEVGQDWEGKVVPGSADYLKDCRDWLLEVEKMVEGGPGGSDCVKEIWRVPMADFGLGKRADLEGPERFKYGFDVLTGKVLPPAELQTEEAKREWITTESWDYRRVWKLRQRRTFVDNEGRPGLGVKDVRTGDVIAIFVGGHVPFVLRLQQSPWQGYRVVGPAYAYGLMDGEGVGDGVPFQEIQLF
jgi:hypothetical protein